MKQIERLENGRTRVRTINDLPSLTDQHYKDQCDVNNIIKKYKKTGQVTHLNRARGVFADLSGITDYHQMVNNIMTAQDAFGKLPAHLRSRFENDPGKLLEFLADSNNKEEAIKLGLVENKQKDDLPQKAHVIQREENGDKVVDKQNNSTPA